jgi:RimJ/RimL family protein N-acetyltransferase
MLIGKLVRLRPLEPADADALWRWNNDPVVQQWMNNGCPESFAQLKKRAEDRPANTYDSMLFCVETVADSVAIGVVRLRDAEPEVGRAELDIYIGEPKYRNGGYGTDTMRVICRYGFDEMRLHGISLWVVADNAAARHVYQKVGFVEEGRQRESFRRAGKWHDVILMSLLEGELVD